MDILDLHVKCQVSLRSKQSQITLYPDSYLGIDTWPSAHIPSLMETEHYRNRYRNSAAMYPDHSSFHPMESHYDVPNMSVSNEHWPSYNYTLHPYTYHGYGQQDTVDVFQPSPLVVSPQQYYPSWHLPYSSESGQGNFDYYGQMYYPSQVRDSVLYSPAQRHNGSDRQHISDISSDQYHNFLGTQDDLMHGSHDHDNRGHYRGEYNMESKYTDKKTCIQTDDKNGMTTSKRPTTSQKEIGIMIQPAETEQHPNSGMISFNSKQSSKMAQEQLYDSNTRLQDTSYMLSTKSVPSDQPNVFRPSVFQPSSHVKKQERKMKKMLHDLQKSDLSKATQLTEFYQFNMAVLEQQYNRYRKDSCDRPGQRSPQTDYDCQVQRVIHQVMHKINISGYRLADSNGRKSAVCGEVRKTRLLPKHAVKTLDTWFEDNLSNPYPSRDQTLHLALDCGLSIEQVRKWFANKRNRSRNNKLYK